MRMLGCVDISFWGGPQLVQDMLRYMFANPVKVVHFKGVVQLRTGAPDAIFHVFPCIAKSGPCWAAQAPSAS